MTVYQHKQDKNLIVCSECAESHTIDLDEYVESAFSECSICGYVDVKAREEYMWWSHKLDSEMSDWEDGSLPMEKE
jgi:ribosomal protein L37E